MLRLVLRRLVALVPLLFVVTLLVWALLLLVPGDPAISLAGETATDEQIEAIRQSLGLNDPIHVRYGKWLGNVVQGDLGTSLFTSYRVTDAIRDRIAVTISLVGSALLLSIAIGVPAGILAAVKRGRLLDRVLTFGTSVGVALPNFWLGLILVTYLSLKLGWFPSGGFVSMTQDPLQWLRHITLPVVTLALAGAAEIGRQMRSSMVDVLDRDFIRTHRAKGLSGSRVVSRYALKNALMPVVTVAGLQVARLFGLSTIVEQIFNLPGIGQLAIDSVFKRDVPMIQGVVLMVTMLVVFVNLVVDVSYGYINPKVRDQ